MYKYKSLIIKVIKEVRLSSLVMTKYVYKRVNNLIKDHNYENKFGIETSELYYYKDDISEFRDGQAYHPTAYYLLEKMIANMEFHCDDVFVDLGCGKGRVVLFLALQNLKKVIGIELHKDLANAAKSNMTKMKSKLNTPVEIINKDATNFNLENCTIFFLNNPFGYKTMEKIIGNINKSLLTNPRKIKILYRHPYSQDILNDKKWLEFKEIIDETDISYWCSKV